MQQKYKILLTLLLSLVIGTPMASAQIVDEQGQYVNTTFHDNVDRMAEDSLGLGKDSVVDGILINTDLQAEVDDGVVMRGDSCETDTIRQTELKTSFFVGYCYDKNRTLKENIWDWTSVILIGLIILCIIVISFKHLSFKLIKEKNVAIQIILILVIAFVAVYSDSHWVYLAIVILCALGIFKLNPSLLEKFVEICKSIYGLETIKMIDTQIEEKVERELNEAKDGYMLANCGDVRRETLKQDITVKKYIELEQLALDILEKEYSNLQKYVQIKAHPKYNFELDGLIEENNIIYAVDVKYIHSLFDMEHLPQRMSKIVDFVARVTGKPTKILLLIITPNEDTRKQVLDEFNNQPISDYTPILKVYIESELEEQRK